VAPTIAAAVGAADMATIRGLFLEYRAWLGVDLCFQDFDAEVACLPGAYAPPGGGLWLARGGGGVLAGCIGLRPQEGGAGEMKRLWVRPAFRGCGLGRRLAGMCIDGARAAGYHCLRLDTLKQMAAAHALYRDLGFREIPAYYANPLDQVRYLELDLTSH